MALAVPSLIDNPAPSSTDVKLWTMPLADGRCVVGILRQLASAPFTYTIGYRIVSNYTWSTFVVLESAPGPDTYVSSDWFSPHYSTVVALGSVLLFKTLTQTVTEFEITTTTVTGYRISHIRWVDAAVVIAAVTLAPPVGVNNVWSGSGVISLARLTDTTAVLIHTQAAGMNMYANVINQGDLRSTVDNRLCRIDLSTSTPTFPNGYQLVTTHNCPPVFNVRNNVLALNTIQQTIIAEPPNGSYYYRLSGLAFVTYLWNGSTFAYVGSSTMSQGGASWSDLYNDSPSQIITCDGVGTGLVQLVQEFSLAGAPWGGFSELTVEGYQHMYVRAFVCTEGGVLSFGASDVKVSTRSSGIVLGQPGIG